MRTTARGPITKANVFVSLAALLAAFALYKYAANEDILPAKAKMILDRSLTAIIVDPSPEVPVLLPQAAKAVEENLHSQTLAPDKLPEAVTEVTTATSGNFAKEASESAAKKANITFDDRAEQRKWFQRQNRGEKVQNWGVIGNSYAVVSEVWCPHPVAQPLLLDSEQRDELWLCAPWRMAKCRLTAVSDAKVVSSVAPASALCQLSSSVALTKTAASRDAWRAGPVVFLHLPYARDKEDGLFNELWAAAENKTSVCQLVIRTQIRGREDCKARIRLLKAISDLKFRLFFESEDWSCPSQTKRGTQPLHCLTFSYAHESCLSTLGIDHRITSLF